MQTSCYFRRLLVRKKERKRQMPRTKIFTTARQIRLAQKLQLTEAEEHRFGPRDSVGNLSPFNSSDFADLSVITYINKRTVATVNIYISIEKFKTGNGAGLVKFSG